MKHPSNMSFIIFKKKISSACKYLFTLNVSIRQDVNISEEQQTVMYLVLVQDFALLWHKSEDKLKKKSYLVISRKCDKKLKCTIQKCFMR